MDKMEKIRCSLCNSDDPEIICARAGLKRGEAKNVINVICNRCGLVYNNPVSSKETLDEWYKEDFLEDKSGSGDYESFVKIYKYEKSAKKAKSVVNFIKPFLRENCSVIDIGCSHGVLLSEIKNQFNCKVKGVEPDFTMVRFAREHFGLKDIENIFFEDFIKNNNEKFDLVILRYVLEHLGKINEAIRDLKSLLRDNGYLFLVVPSAADFKPSRDLGHSLEFGHLYSFTPYTIHQLFLKHGMKVVKWSFDRIFGIQAVVTSVDNPVDAVPAEDMEEGLDVKRIKKRLKRHNYRYFLFRLKRKIKTILRLRWKE